MTGPNDNDNKELYEAPESSSAQPEVKLAEVPAEVKQKLRRNLAGPESGFGPLWYKSYKIALNRADLAPEQVIQDWKANFSKFWPRGYNFYEPLSGLSKGDVVLVQSEVGGLLPISTGLVVVQDSPESFTLLTAKGHVFTGKITFLARQEAGVTVAEVRVLYRSADPFVELFLRSAGHTMEDRFWQITLRNLARHYGTVSPVKAKAICVNRAIRWSSASNLRFNPLWRTTYDIVQNPANFIGKTSRRFSTVL